jgi:hypothetical protein
MAGIIESFNINSYKKLATQSFGKSFWFLVVFVMIVSSVISLKGTLAVKKGLAQFNLFLNQHLESIVSGLPPIEIKNGTLILPKEPYVKEWQGKYAIVIEPAEEFDNSILEKYNNCLLFTQKKLIMKQTDEKKGKSEIQIYKLEKFGYFKISPIQSGLKIEAENKQFNLTPSSVGKFSKIIQWFIFPVLFLWLFFWYGFAKMAQVFVFSVFSLIFKASLKAVLSYRELLTIGIYAIVPPTCVALVKEIFNIRLSWFWCIYSAMYVTYLYLAVKSCKEAPESAAQN